MDKYYKCIKCGKIYPFTKDILTCQYHNPYYSYLTLMYDYDKVNIGNKKGLFYWNKYLDLLPINNFQINFNEQKTPLVKIKKFGFKYGIQNIYVKDESKNPTGSFKDKGSICAVNKALEWNIQNIFIVSSGNAAVSLSAYAHKAGIQCVNLVPKKLTVGKRFLISLYGGELKEINGNYEQIYRWVIDNSYRGWNCTPGINPIADEGIKIIGYEIWEEIGVPDIIVIPCGNGTLLFGIYKAFKELQFLGLTNKLPKLIGVQIKNAAPLKTAWQEKKDFVKLSGIPSSIAEGIIAEESYSSPKVIIALEDTGGEIIEVDDQEIIQALSEIIKLESLIPEPTAAVVFAAVKKLILHKHQKIVLIQSSGGMKNLKEIMESFIK